MAVQTGIENSKAVTLAIVAPCYNEELILEQSCGELLEQLEQLKAKGRISQNSSIYFVDDGSTDTTWEKVMDLNRKYPCVRGVRLSRNFGHQAAIMAGMTFVGDRYDAIVTLDVDLQDDITTLERFVNLFQEGYEIVYGVRRKRQTDGAFKRWTALAFYRLMSIMGVEIIDNHGDYRLIGRRPLQALADFTEVNLFLRGIFPLMGFKSGRVEYDRKVRAAGETKFTPLKMLNFAINGITSFSVKPLRIIAVLGIAIFVGSLVLSVWAFLVALFKPSAVRGWASTVLPIYFLGGLQTTFMGILGEYVGRIYHEIKGRPRLL